MGPCHALRTGGLWLQINPWVCCRVTGAVLPIPCTMPPGHWHKHRPFRAIQRQVPRWPSWEELSEKSWLKGLEFQFKSFPRALGGGRERWHWVIPLTEICAVPIMHLGACWSLRGWAQQPSCQGSPGGGSNDWRPHCGLLISPPAHKSTSCLNKLNESQCLWSQC